MLLNQRAGRSDNHCDKITPPRPSEAGNAEDIDYGIQLTLYCFHVAGSRNQKSSSEDRHWIIAAAGFNFQRQCPFVSLTTPAEKKTAAAASVEPTIARH